MGGPFGGPHNKDYSIWGSILGSTYFGKLTDKDGTPSAQRVQTSAFSRVEMVSTGCQGPQAVFDLIRGSLTYSVYLGFADEVDYHVSEKY